MDDLIKAFEIQRGINDCKAGKPAETMGYYDEEYLEAYRRTENQKNQQLEEKAFWL